MEGFIVTGRCWTSPNVTRSTSRTKIVAQDKFVDVRETPWAGSEERVKSRRLARGAWPAPGYIARLSG